jgi:hypothetical protein
VKEAIKAARAAGLENFRVDIDKQGTISVVPMGPGEKPERGRRVGRRSLKLPHGCKRYLDHTGVVRTYYRHTSPPNGAAGSALVA